MLTRLKVTGFKNLVDVDLHFGPFTCIAGGNAVGKSNLFDAIMFLGALAEMPLVEAAMAVRDKSGRSSDIRSLFHATNRGLVEGMSFDAEMIIPEEGVDDLGQTARANITFVRYQLEITYRETAPHSVRPGLEITKENLDYISLGEASKHLPFKPSSRWKRSVLRGRRTSPFISTDVPGQTIRLHQEGRAGRTRNFLTSTLPRTVLSTVNAAESPTALLTRREMQSWRLLQLEPSALRASDPFTAPSEMGSDGSHLPSTLYHLAKSGESKHASKESDVYSAVGNRLSQLVDDVRSVTVDRDDRRELFTLMVKTNDETTHAARSLSDGTLRFLALAVLEANPRATGVLCLEEPENGIHPERIVAMLRLLQDLAVDTDEPVDKDNPLRQVIINTHSPAVVAQAPDDSVVFAEKADRLAGNVRSTAIVFRYLENTWRAKANKDMKAIQRGRIIKFLSPVMELEDTDNGDGKRVIDRPEISQLLLWPPPQ